MPFICGVKYNWEYIIKAGIIFIARCKALLLIRLSHRFFVFTLILLTTEKAVFLIMKYISKDAASNINKKIMSVITNDADSEIFKLFSAPLTALSKLSFIAR